MKKRILLYLTQILLFVLSAEAYDFNRRHFSVEQGLSSMSVLSLMQDSDGYVWAGSVDGLNRIMNNSIKVWGAGDNGTSQLSGNLIEHLDQTDDGTLWIHTNYGLDCFDTDINKIVYFREFNGTYLNAVSPRGDVIVYTPENRLYTLNHSTGRFDSLPLKIRVPFNTVNPMSINSANELWIISDAEALYMPVERHPDGSVSLGVGGSVSLGDSPVYWSGNAENDKLYYATRANRLYRLDTDSRSTCFIHTLDEALAARGDVSAATDLGNDFIIGFKTGGAVMLLRHKNREGFETVPMGISSGIFDIMKDKRRGVIWLATDGEGVWRFSREPHIFFSDTFSRLPFTTGKPVRAVFKDKNGDLWAGTKGDGVIRYPSYSPSAPSRSACTALKVSNSSLLDNSVYCFAPSNRNLFWVGGDGNGINYWSYSTNSLQRLPHPDLPMLRFIHGIVEIEDELWVATVGYGVFRLRLGGTPDKPEVISARQLFYTSDQPQSNQFFSIAAYNDSIVWIGNRGKGLYRYNRLSDTNSIIEFNAEKGLLNNDILAIGRIPGHTPIYLGTSMGLLELLDTSSDTPTVRRIDIGSHGTVNTVHAIAADTEGNLWATTNYGLIQYQPESKSLNTFGISSGIGIMSYCDGAAFASPDGECFFGGTNGILAVEPTGIKADDYMPPVIFQSVIVGNTDTNIDPSQPLEFSHDKNTFSIDFSAVDYWKGHDFRYSYRLLGASDTWIDNGNSSRISFTNLPPGKYRLQVRYHNGNTLSNIYELPIRISPPWYASVWAMIIYVILIIAAFIAVIVTIMRKQHQKRRAIIKEMEHQQKEDVYESKLRFFTNITHELCTPLSLILGSCQRILDGKNQDEATLRFTSLIQRNSRRLNELIQELIEFRRIDTDHRKPDVEMVDVSALTTEIAENFNIMAEQKHVDFTTSIVPAIEWPTDRSGFITIVTNLLSNAFKYTPDNGTIRITLTVDNHPDGKRLNIDVANSGAGIAPENIGKIFDRYTVLERFERKSAAGAIERNGLGLAICHGLTKLLSGDITVKSIPDSMTTFSVSLPEIAVTRTEPAPEQFHFEEKPAAPDEQPDFSKANFTYDKGRPTIFIVDDDRETLWFIADTLSDSYNVEPFTSAENALERLSVKHPDLVITDIIMGGASGLELTAEIKGNKATGHIPVIQLSSLQSDPDKLKGLEAGADMYLTKPFNIDFLRSAVANLLRRDNSLKNYYESSLSAFELIDGKILHKDDKEFMEQMIRVVHDNINHPSLSTQFVADQMKISMRCLYRRLEGITEETPTVVIKKVRLDIARQLLIKSNLSIEEIIYRAGFNNRGTFFKLFSATYGCTPRQYREQQISSAKETLSSD